MGSNTSADLPKDGNPLWTGRSIEVFLGFNPNPTANPISVREKRQTYGSVWTHGLKRIYVHRAY